MSASLCRSGGAGASIKDSYSFGSAASPSHFAGGGPTSPTSKTSHIEDALLALIALQLFDGSWDPEAPELYKLILSAALQGTTQGGYPV